MGATDSRSNSPQPRLYETLDYGYCTVWKRKDNQQQTMEQYNVIIQNEKELDKYIKMWEIRTQSEQIVRVHYFTHRSNNQICNVLQEGYILTERIPYRLSQFCNIPYEEALSILKKVLQSYKILYQWYGVFYVRSTMIGISGNKRIKIWHHTDYSSPDPQNMNCKSLSEMLDSIVGSIQLNADIPYDYVRFSEFINVNRQKIIPNFDQMLQVLQIYKQMNKLRDYPELPQLVHYVRQAEGWQEIALNQNFMTNLSKIAQLNQFSQKKQSFASGFLRESSLSSNSTLKNNPSINIYTHKDVNQIMKREREQTVFSNSRVQLSSSKPSLYQRSNSRQNERGRYLYEKRQQQAMIKRFEPSRGRQSNLGQRNINIKLMSPQTNYRSDSRARPIQSSIQKQYKTNVTPKASIYTSSPIELPTKTIRLNVGRGYNTKNFKSDQMFNNQIHTFNNSPSHF